MCTCADPERFVKGGPIFTVFMGFFVVDEGDRGSKFHTKRAIIGPPAKLRLNGVRWRADDGHTLNSGLVAL